MDADEQQAGGQGDGGRGESPELFDFLDAYYEDLAEGQALTLERYLERFPGHEASITREFEAQEALRGAQASSSVPAGEGIEEDSRAGPYRLLSEIGRGGQGVVFLAEDTRISRRVALKVLPPAALLLSEDRRRRLQREAEVVSRLAHPGICGIFDAEIGRELAYIAMPFVEGRTLSSVIAQMRDAERDGTHGEDEAPPPIAVQPKSEAELARLLQFFEEAARALHSAHEAGVVHRDIKPGNLMVTPEGSPIWLDFGQARDVESQIADLTLSGEIFGTPAYMSPEQVAGRPSDARTDVWALGVSLFEALTLRRPFEGASVHALLLAVQADETPDPRQLTPIIGEELAVVIATALERDVTRRYASALALAEDLARLRRREPIHARPAGRVLRVRRWVQRHPVLAALILTISLSLAVTSYLLAEQVRITAIKDENLSWAVGRHLAERSEALLAEDPASALILGIEAVERAPNYLTREALFGALEACQLRVVYDAKDEPEGQNRFAGVALVPGGELVAALRFDGEVRVYDLVSGERRAGWKAHPPSADPKQRAGRSIACAANGRLVATGGRDGRVSLREVATGESLLEFDGPGGAVTALCFGADDQTLAVRGEEGGLAFHRTADGERLTWLAEDDGRAIHYDAATGRFRELPLSAEAPDRLRQWVAATGEPGRYAHLPRGLRAFLDWTPKGWIGIDEDGLLIEERSDHLPLSTHALLEPGERVLLARRSAASRHLFLVTEVEASAATGFEPVQRARLVGLALGTVIELAVTDDGAPTEAAFSPTGDRLAVIDADSVVRVWDVLTGSLLATCRGYQRPHFLEWSADGAWLLTHSRNGTVARLWYGTERPDVYRLRCGGAPVKRVEFSADGEHAMTTAGGEVSLWHTPSAAAHGTAPGTLLARMRELGEPQAEAPLGSTRREPFGRSVSGRFTPAGDQVLLWGEGRIELLAVEGLRPMATLHPGGAILDVCPHPAGESMAVLVRGSDHLGGPAGAGEWPEVRNTGARVRVFTGIGEFLHELAVSGDGPRAVRYSPDGTRLVTTHQSGVLRCWDPTTGEELWRVPRAEEMTAETLPAIVDLAFRPDSSEVAVALADRRVSFYSVEDGSESRPYLSVFPPSSIDWSADGRRLLVTGPSGRGAVRVENLDPPDPANNVLRAEFFHGDDLTGGTFSPDGRLVLTTSRDGTIMVRDVSGEEDARSMVLLAHLKGSGSAVLDACFSGGDGPLRVLAGFEDGTARVWPVDPLPAARARRPRVELQDWELAREERLARPLEYP